MKVNATILAGALSLGAMSSFAAIRAVTPVAWNGDPNCWQMKRHVAKMSEVAAGGAQVVFIGDSITHFWETNGKAQWDKYFASGKYRALNLGTSADRTEHVLWRITEGGELDGYEAKVILLMIGTNNAGHFPFEKEPPVDTILGVAEILKVIAEKQPNARTILTAIFPRGAGADDPCRLRNDVVNRELAKFADGRKVIWCDFSDKFLGPGGRLSCDLFPDLLHPNGLGYEMWASAVLPVVERVFAAGEGEAIPSVWPSCPMNYECGKPVPAMAVRGGNYWPARYLEKRNAIVDGDGEYDIVMVGDSITHRWERNPDGEGRELFAELKKTYRILNLGYGGDRTENVAWRMENGELEGYKAKMFTVMIGTNNGGRDVGGIAAGVKRIVGDIRERHPESKIVLMPIFPRGATAEDENRRRNEKVNAIIRGYADGETVLWLDFNDKFFNAEGKLTKEVMNDLLHPNEKGYRIWLDAILPTFRKICGE
jgi:lysophospholipase L1-like esterase